MSSPPTKEQLMSLFESMCEVQDRMLGARGMPEHIQRPHVDNMEALKAPVFFCGNCLDMERRENCPKKALGGSGWRVLDLHRGNTWKSVYRCLETTKCRYQNTMEGQG